MVGKEMSKSLSFLFVVLSSRLIRMFKVRCHLQPASMGVSGLSQPPNKAGISEVSKIKVRRASSVVSRMEKVFPCRSCRQSPHIQTLVSMFPGRAPPYVMARRNIIFTASPLQRPQRFQQEDLHHSRGS